MGQAWHVAIATKYIERIIDFEMHLNSNKMDNYFFNKRFCQRKRANDVCQSNKNIYSYIKDRNINSDKTY